MVHGVRVSARLPVTKPCIGERRASVARAAATGASEHRPWPTAPQGGFGGDVGRLPEVNIVDFEESWIGFFDHVAVVVDVRTWHEDQAPERRQDAFEGGGFVVR